MCTSDTYKFLRDKGTFPRYAPRQETLTTRCFTCDMAMILPKSRDEGTYLSYVPW